MITQAKSQPVPWTPATVWIAVVCVAAFIASSQAQTFFAQPQSHLGRLVQSITSPLVLSAGGGSFDGESSAASPYESSDSVAPSSNGYSQQSNQQNSHYQQYRPASAGVDSRYQQLQHQGLQQAPSQQRGIPQQYSEADESDEGDSYGEPSSSSSRANMGARKQHQPSQQYFHQQRNENQPAGANHHQEYQMGAYLGPTIDDKEIQGAFNSNNDERDEDDGPAGYQGPPAEGAGQRAAAGSSADAYQDNYSGYSGAPSRPAASAAAAAGSYDPDNESSSADEETDEPTTTGGRSSRARGGRRGNSGGLNQAASQYHKQQQPRARTNQQLATAANGYAPYGPIDLSGLMAAANGGQPGGYEVYNGDGSYNGGGFGGGFGPPQQQRGNGRRQQAASMNNGFGYGGYDGYGPQQQRQQQHRQGGAEADDDPEDNED